MKQNPPVTTETDTGITAINSAASPFFSCNHMYFAKKQQIVSYYSTKCMKIPLIP